MITLENSTNEEICEAVIGSVLAQTNPYPYKKQTCCICNKIFVGYGNNPAPITQEGRCCDDCNTGKVIPARLIRYSLGLDMRGE